MEDPVAIVVAPAGDAVLVVSGFGDALLRLLPDPGATPPFALAGQLTYSGGRPQLPGATAAVRRGPLTGLVLVAENQGLRRVRFDGGGAITDLGRFSLGSGIPAIPGALGVEP